MKTEYAFQAFDASGLPRAWFDAFPTKQLMTCAARDYASEHPGWKVEPMKRATPAGQIGAAWERTDLAA